MAKKRQSRTKSSHGGRRSGSGRKSTEAKKLRADLIAEADKIICDNLPRLIGNLLKLANGGYERVEEEFEPGGGGTPILTKRKVSVAEPDRAANQYLIDRILGKPKQAVEMSGPNGGAIPLSIEDAIAKVYGETTAE